MTRASSTSLTTIIKMQLVGFLCLISAFILIAVTTQNAYAESRQCRDLRSQLTNLTVHGVSAPKVSKAFKHFNSLSNRQEAALNNARRDAYSYGCVTRSGKITGTGAPSCPALLNKIGKMKFNLKKLNQQRDRVAPKGLKEQKSAREIKKIKRKIRAKMRRLRCGAAERYASETKPKQKETRTKRPGLLARIFGKSSRIHRNGDSRWRRERILRVRKPSEERLALNDNLTYGRVVRTLCVRICDGYYFPVSFATVRKSFDADRAFCKASNPSTEMRLFFHHNPSESSEDMRDLQGRPYAELPNAFRYRQEVVDNQTCPRRPIQESAFTQVAGNALSKVKTARGNKTNGRYVVQKGSFAKIIAKPTAKPNLFADQDTQLAIVGNFELTPFSDNSVLAQTNVLTIYDPAKISDNGIRVIGPTFLDDRQSAKLLQDPDQIQVQ